MQGICKFYNALKVEGLGSGANELFCELAGVNFEPVCCLGIPERAVQAIHYVPEKFG